MLGVCWSLVLSKIVVNLLLVIVWSNRLLLDLSKVILLLIVVASASSSLVLASEVRRTRSIRLGDLIICGRSIVHVWLASLNV